MTHRIPGIPFVALLVLTAVAASSQRPAAPAPPDTEIYLASATVDRQTLTVGQPVNITNSPGYDNQPSFTPDGGAILFTSIRGGTQTDIYRYDVASGATTRVTNTPESEYSPTVTPDGRHISVIRVEADGAQRLWRFTLGGAEPELVLKDVKPVGYHAWTDDRTLALFVLGQPATLQIADTETGKAESIVRGINRSIQRIPGRGTVSVVQRIPSAGANDAAVLKISEFDPKSRHVTPLVDAVAGAKEADLAWTPDGMLLMAEKDALYGWRRGDPGWHVIVDLARLGVHGVSRIAVSPKGDRIAFVAGGQP